MTCIVGVVDNLKKTVTIGADSAEISAVDITIRKDKKVFKVKEFIIGCTSSFRMIQLLRFSLELEEVKDKDIYEYMCTNFINSVRECFKKGGFLQKYDRGDEAGGSFLVGYKERLFHIQDDFQVSETIRGYDSCGCGAPYALGAIFNTSKTDADKIVIEALEAAQFFSAGVHGPFITYST